jgi:hypothetical protein
MTDEGAISAFEKLLGRESKPAEREQLYRVKEALGLRDNDALWLVLFALQYYDSLYRQFPKAIGQEALRVWAKPAPQPMPRCGRAWSRPKRN